MLQNCSKVALLGTGIMGFQMARRLCQAGIPLQVWNRTRAKAAPLAEFGAEVADTAHAAVADAELVIAMLADYEAARELYFEKDLLSAIGRGRYLVDMATYAPDEARELAAAAAAKGLFFIDAPVSGGERGAAEGTLSIMAGGEGSVLDAIMAVFAPLGRVTHVGPVGSGSVAKLCNQIIVGDTVLAVAEALNFAARMGADPKAVHAALLGGFADSVILKEHGKRMVESDFKPGGPAKYMQKILVTAARIAAEKDIPLPLAKQSGAVFDRMAEAGRGDLDLSGVIEELRRES